MSLALVIKNVVPLKLHPCTECETADEVLHGMVVEVLDKANEEWYLVKTHYDYEGFIHKDAILVDDKRANEWRDNNYVVWKLIADAMAEPNYKNSELITLTRGAMVKHTGIVENKWEKVGLADGRFGWIREGFARYVEKPSLQQEEDRLRSDIVQTAMQYMGTQYRWGGKSPLGIDCSGLSSMAYMLNGIVIPRDGGPQEEYLRTIDRNQAKPGDLFFFPGHVAICIGGERYIHSTGREGYVLINSLNPHDRDYREDHDKNLTSTGTIFGMEA